MNCQKALTLTELLATMVVKVGIFSNPPPRNGLSKARRRSKKQVIRAPPHIIRKRQYSVFRPNVKFFWILLFARASPHIIRNAAISRLSFRYAAELALCGHRRITQRRINHVCLRRRAVQETQVSFPRQADGFFGANSGYCISSGYNSPTSNNLGSASLM